MLLKILFLGDIVAKPGREAVIKELPKIKKQLKPDLVLANAENLAHIHGVTLKTLKEISWFLFSVHATAEDLSMI